MNKPFGSNHWSVLPQIWIHIGLPGIRESGRRATYEVFPASELPDIPIELDDDCDWLARYGVAHSTGLNRYQNGDPAFVVQLALEASIQLPKSFRRFMLSEELQARVRSVTDCYLDPGERVVKTV